MKQALVVRGDLDMGTGKLAAQVAHASLTAYEKASNAAQTEWKQAGQTKVVLRVDSERQLFECTETAKSANLPCALIRDAGRTQLDPETPTTLGIGPAKDHRIDEVTGDLSLY